MPSGQLRVDATSVFVTWDERFGYRNVAGLIIEEVEPLGWALTSDGLGSDRLPGPFDGQDILRTLLEDQDYRHNLGQSRHLLEAHVRRIPFSVDVGVTSWLTVGATVPLVQRRIDSDFVYDAQGANAGVTPGAGAAAPFISDFQLALAESGLAVDDVCLAMGDTSSECLDGRAFLLDSAGLLQSLDAFYASASYAPLSGSPASDALNQMVDDVRGTMATYGVDTFTAPLQFASAIDQATFESQFIDPNFNQQGLPIDGVSNPWELGDVEVHAAIRLLDTTRRRRGGPAPAADSSSAEPMETESGRLGVRLGVAGLVRLGTGVPQDTLRDFLDMDVAEGQMDIEVRGFGDILFGRHVGLRFDARYGIASPATVKHRVAGPDDLLVRGLPTAMVEWTPGNYLDVAVVPELLLTPELALGFVFRQFTRGEDTYDGTAAGVDASPLMLETEATKRSMGVEVRYSTLLGRAQGATNMPMEIRFSWESARSGSGGRTPKTGTVRLGVSVFRRLWGGG